MILISLNLGNLGKQVVVDDFQLCLEGLVVVNFLCFGMLWVGWDFVDGSLFIVVLLVLVDVVSFFLVVCEELFYGSCLKLLVLFNFDYFFSYFVCYIDLKLMLIEVIVYDGMVVMIMCDDLFFGIWYIVVVVL